MANGNNPSNGKGTGKGGNFDTRKNPFASKKPTNNRPRLDDTASLGTALDAILDTGNAVIIGATRDGGALVFTILDGEERHRTYCSNDEELDEAIGEIIALYKD